MAIASDQVLAEAFDARSEVDTTEFDDVVGRVRAAGAASNEATAVANALSVFGHSSAVVLGGDARVVAGPHGNLGDAVAHLLAVGLHQLAQVVEVESVSNRRLVLYSAI